VSNPLAKLRGLGELGVHVVGEKISRVAGVDHHIRFRNRAADRFARSSNLNVFEVNRFHRTCMADLRLVDSG
jgi:hypothetical protein